MRRNTFFAQRVPERGSQLVLFFLGPNADRRLRIFTVEKGSDGVLRLGSCRQSYQTQGILVTRLLSVLLNKTFIIIYNTI